MLLIVNSTQRKDIVYSTERNIFHFDHKSNISFIGVIAKLFLTSSLSLCLSLSLSHTLTHMHTHVRHLLRKSQFWGPKSDVKERKKEEEKKLFGLNLKFRRKLGKAISMKNDQWRQLLQPPSSYY